MAGWHYLKERITLKIFKQNNYQKRRYSFSMIKLLIRQQMFNHNLKLRRMYINKWLQTNLSPSSLVEWGTRNKYILKLKIRWLKIIYILALIRECFQKVKFIKINLKIAVTEYQYLFHFLIWCQKKKSKKWFRYMKWEKRIWMLKL